MKSHHRLLLGGFVALTLCSCSASRTQTSLDNHASEKIIGGTSVSPTDPTASLTAILYDTRQYGTCTATVVSDEWLLTAAHCVDNANIGFLDIIFTTDLDELEKREPGVSTVRDLESSGSKELIRSVDRVVESDQFKKSDRAIAVMIDAAHALGTELTTDAYDAVRDRGDLALIHISGKIPAQYHPAVLNVDRHLKRGDPIQLAGFGVNVYDDPESAGTLRETAQDVADPAWGSSEFSVDQRSGKGACHGDSGGPAFIQDPDGKLILVGVTSRGARDDRNDCTQFAVYTDLRDYASWIRQVLVPVSKP